MLLFENLKWMVYQVYAPIRYFTLRRKRRLRDISRIRAKIEYGNRWPRRSKDMSDADYWEAASDKLRKEMEIKMPKRVGIRIPGPKRERKFNPNIRTGGIRLDRKPRLKVSLVKNLKDARRQLVKDAIDNWDVWDSRR